MALGGWMQLDLDGAWPPARPPALAWDGRAWGPRLRHSAPRSLVEEFYRQVSPHLAPFTLYGSGDFHYLTALWLRQVGEPVTLISFDNHPDWDIRPPHWGCGGWLNRALELPGVERACVWGCGNFEMNRPWRLFANRAALRSGRLSVHPWAERYPPATRSRFACMTRDTWRDHFLRSLESLAHRRVYVTIDLDCLREREAVTNWENGLFCVEDLVWALAALRRSATVIGGDLCGAYSPPSYARRTQALAGRFDHPARPAIDGEAARAANTATLERLWPALTGRG